MTESAKHGKVRDVLGRRDYAIIGSIVEPGSKVLDLGCGEADLLKWLVDNKQVQARGVEMDAIRVKNAIARGLSVYQGDIDSSLPGYPDQAFDYVILSQTLQETMHPMLVLKEMLRVGRRAVVAFPNFGHWRVRLSHLLSGRAPQTDLFPHRWYDSPNIHFLTIDDFEELVQEMGWTVDKRVFLSGAKEVVSRPNLTAEIAVFLFRK